MRTRWIGCFLMGVLFAATPVAALQLSDFEPGNFVEGYEILGLKVIKVEENPFGFTKSVYFKSPFIGREPVAVNPNGSLTDMICPDVELEEDRGIFSVAIAPTDAALDLAKKFLVDLWLEVSKATLTYSFLYSPRAMAGYCSVEAAKGNIEPGILDPFTWYSTPTERDNLVQIKQRECPTEPDAVRISCKQNKCHGIAAIDRLFAQRVATRYVLDDVPYKLSVMLFLNMGYQILALLPDEPDEILNKAFLKKSHIDDMEMNLKSVLGIKTRNEAGEIVPVKQVIEHLVMAPERDLQRCLNSVRPAGQDIDPDSLTGKFSFSFGAGPLQIEFNADGSIKSISGGIGAIAKVNFENQRPSSVTFGVGVTGGFGGCTGDLYAGMTCDVPQAQDELINVRFTREATVSAGTLSVDLIE